MESIRHLLMAITLLLFGIFICVFDSFGYALPMFIRYFVWGIPVAAIVFVVLSYKDED